MSSYPVSTHLDTAVMIAIIIYLAGAATPLILMRLIATEQSDSCFLGALVWAIGLVIISMSIFLLSRHS